MDVDMSLQGLEDEQKELPVRFHSKQLAIAHGIRSTSCKMWKDEQKELLVGFHSERLAVAYGLHSCGTLIWDMRNLRVCTDYHKFISYAYYLLNSDTILNIGNVRMETTGK